MCRLFDNQEERNPDAKVVNAVSDWKLTKSDKQESCRVATIEVTVNTRSRLRLGTSGIRLILLKNLGAGCENVAS